MNGVKGSFILGALASDGLLIASDSRGNFFKIVDDNPKSILYFDGVRKIFHNKKLGIAFTGLGMIGGYFLNYYLDKFFKDWEVDYFDPILSFFRFLDYNFKSEVYSSFKQQKILAINYFDNSPQISYWDNNKDPNYSCIINGYIQSDKSKFNELYNKSLNSIQLTNLIIDSISEYSKGGNNYLTINDDISILRITPDGSSWINFSEKNKFWLSYQDLRFDLLSGNVAFQLIGDFKISDLDSLI